MFFSAPLWLLCAGAHSKVNDAAGDVRKLAFTLEALRQPAPFSESCDLVADMVAAVDWMAGRSASVVQ